MYLRTYFLFVVNILFLCLPISDFSMKALLIIAIVDMLYFGYIFRSYMMVTVLTFFILLNLLYMIPYYFWGIPYATRTYFQDYLITSKTLKDLVVFNLVLFVSLNYFFSRVEHLNNVIETLKIRNNPINYIASLIVILILIMLNILSGPSLLSGTYGIDVAVDRYAFIDYTVFLIFGTFLFTTKKLQLRFLFLISLVYIAINLMYGLRLRALEAMLLIFILFFENRISYIKIICYSSFGFVVMKFIELIRTNQPLGAHLLHPGEVMVSNAGGVFLTSNIFRGLLDAGTISTDIRFKTLVGYVSSFFKFTNEIDINYILPKFVGQYYSIPGGGFIFAFMRVWGGLPLVILSGIVIAYLITYAYRRDSNAYLKFYSVLVLATFPKWYSYTPIIFFKLMIWGLIYYFILNQFHRMAVKGMRGG